MQVEVGALNFGTTEITYEKDMEAVFIPCNKVDRLNGTLIFVEQLLNKDNEYIGVVHEVDVNSEFNDEPTLHMSTQYRILINADGQIYTNSGIVKSPIWLRKIKTKHHMCQRPYNKEANQYLIYQEPLYVNKHIWICADKTIYIKSRGVWLTIADDLQSHIIKNMQGDVGEELRMACNLAGVQY